MREGLGVRTISKLPLRHGWKKERFVCRSLCKTQSEYGARKSVLPFYFHDMHSLSHAGRSGQLVWARMHAAAAIVFKISYSNGGTSEHSAAHPPAALQELFNKLYIGSFTMETLDTMIVIVELLCSQSLMQMRSVCSRGQTGGVNVFFSPTT